MCPSYQLGLLLLDQLIAGPLSQDKIVRPPAHLGYRLGAQLQQPGLDSSTGVVVQLASDSYRFPDERVVRIHALTPQSTSSGRQTIRPSIPQNISGM